MAENGLVAFGAHRLLPPVRYGNEYLLYCIRATTQCLEISHTQPTDFSVPHRSNVGEVYSFERVSHNQHVSRYLKTNQIKPQYIAYKMLSYLSYNRWYYQEQVKKQGEE